LGITTSQLEWFSRKREENRIYHSRWRGKKRKKKLFHATKPVVKFWSQGEKKKYHKKYRRQGREKEKETIPRGKKKTGEVEYLYPTVSDKKKKIVPGGLERKGGGVRCKTGKKRINGGGGASRKFKKGQKILSRENSNGRMKNWGFGVGTLKSVEEKFAESCNLKGWFLGQGSKTTWNLESCGENWGATKCNIQALSDDKGRADAKGKLRGRNVTRKKLGG